MKEKRFKAGDMVTYKRPEDCPDARYRYGGTYPTQPLKKIRRYIEFDHRRDCWVISVQHEGCHFNMLEDEFLEYDSVQENLSNYSIF